MTILDVAVLFTIALLITLATVTLFETCLLVARTLFERFRGEDISAHPTSKQVSQTK